MRMRYADIIVDISHEKLNHSFTYRIPEALSAQIQTGCMVMILFGKGERLIRGYVVALKDEAALPDEKLKSIQSVVTDEETVDARLVQLAAWMSHEYGSTTIQALKTVMPLRKKIQAKQTKLVILPSEEVAREALLNCRRKHYRAKERVLLSMLQKNRQLLPELLQETRVAASVVAGLCEQHILEMDISDSYRKVVTDGEKMHKDVLTDEQEEAVLAIENEWEAQNRPTLLYGITGSGKTLVYMELIADVLKSGKEAIVLIPEIALTQQTVSRFVSRFGDRVSFLHSRLSQGEKYDQMKAARTGDISIMVGPRSALFTPFSHLGLIVVDEEHEGTYHSEQIPRYDAREVAVYRAKQEGAHVLLGSATPSVESMYATETGRYFGVTLKNRYGRAQLPKTAIIDMRRELERGNRSIFSDYLSDQIKAALLRKEQVILFLNRRGYEGHMTCRSCGHVVKCPHCDVSLTRHRDGRLVCHYCGYEMPALRECPKCHSKMIGGFSIGTEQVEEMTQRLFPQARILRMDADTTRTKQGHAKLLRQFGNHEADILIGTQMIVKGHDFPLVTVVGVLMADLSLNEADYRSSEKTFQLITQAVGRAGRGEHSGIAVIQTYHPEHPAVVAAAAQNYEAFYQEEMLYRHILSYPPAGAMAAVLASCENETLLKTAMDYIRAYIRRIDPNDALHTLGPAPQSVGKIRDRYRMVIYMRHNDREALIRAKDRIEAYIAVNKGFSHIDIQFDIC